MESEPRPGDISDLCDVYLGHHKHSYEAYQHVIAVLNKYDYFVTTARSRALEELRVPMSNVTVLPVPKPREPLPPDHTAEMFQFPL